MGSGIHEEGQAVREYSIFRSEEATCEGKVTLERGGVAKSCKVVSWTMDAASGESEIQFLVPKKLTAATDYTLRISNSVGSDTMTFEVR